MASEQTFQTLSRRGLLRGAGLICGAGALAPAGLAAGPAAADSKFSKSMAKYQATPKGGQHCAVCTQFEPAATCRVVQGQVSPSGWCLLFAQK